MSIRAFIIMVTALLGLGQGRRVRSLFPGVDTYDGHYAQAHDHYLDDVPDVPDEPDEPDVPDEDVDPSSPEDQARLAAEQVEAMMNDPQVQQELQEFEELLETEPEFKQQLEEMLADPSLQEQARQVQEQIEDTDFGSSSSFVQVAEGSDETPYWKAMAAHLLMSNPSNAFQQPKLNSRREAMGKAAAALAAAAGLVAGADGASAKAGEFGKQSLFGDSPNVMSSPYVDGGPKGAGEDTTFGVSKSEGPILATGYEKDVSRENKAFLESARRFESLQSKIDKKEWWFVRDELRIQAYTMRASMLALNKVNSKPDAAKALYEDFWTKVETFDEGCRRKSPELANAGYKALLGALSTYKSAVA